MKGWHIGKHYPSDLNRPFGRFMHSRLVEHYIRTSNDLSVLGVPNSVSDLDVGSIPEENGFPLSRFEFPAVILRYEGICLATEAPQLVITRLVAGPYFLRDFKS